MSDYTSNQWEHIKALRPTSIMTHVSKTFIRHPLAILAEQMNQVYAGPQFMANPGVTLDTGRNKRKRAAREGLARKQWPKVA